MKSKELKEKIDEAIGRMADLAKANPDSQKALHFSQSALNLSHARSIIQVVHDDKPDEEVAHDDKPDEEVAHDDNPNEPVNDELKKTFPKQVSKK